MNWNLAKEYFDDDGMLIDVYYEHMTTDGWLKLFAWLSNNPDVSSVNCYIPETGENLDRLPHDVDRYIESSGFYCFVSLLIEGMTIILRFYEASELECDVSPSEVNEEIKLMALLDTLEKIKSITSTDHYLICPENNKNGAFIINGELRV